MASPMRVAESVANTEQYTDYGVNPYTDTRADRLSTFAIDVDTASYAISRRKLVEGQLPDQAAVRAEEFVNAFDYHYEAPTSGPFAVHMTGAPSPYVKDHHLLRIGLQTKRPGVRSKRAHLVYLVDTSGSMHSADKLGLAKESLRMLTEQLQPGDTVALCTYAGDTRIVLEPTGDRAKILAAIDELSAGGSTAMASGIDNAYALAGRTFEKGAINRVIVLSDGDANVGPTSHEEILRRIAQYKERGITLSTVGFGAGNYKDTMMEQLADKGDGNYTYIDSKQAAHKAFVQNLGAMLDVVARDVKVQVEFDPQVVRTYRLIGYENRDVADKDFRNDKVDGGEVGAGHSVTALYDVVLASDAQRKSPATVRIRYQSPIVSGGAVQVAVDSVGAKTVDTTNKPAAGAKSVDGASELAFVMPASALLNSFVDTPRNFQRAVAVAGFAETLRRSPYAGGMDITLGIAKRANDDSEEDRELLVLMEKAIALGAARASLTIAR